MEDLLELILGDIKDDVQKLNDFLIACNITPKKKSLKELIKDLDKIIAIKKGEKYIGIETVDGVVCNIANIDGIVKKQDLPADILRGYYLYKDGKIILDEKLRQKIWG